MDPTVKKLLKDIGFIFEELEELNGFEIVFDRMVFESPLRKNIGNNVDNIDEHYIIDITDYYN